MEAAKSLSLLTDYSKFAKQEYEELETIGTYDQNAAVPNLKEIDASFIKTPYLEENPITKKAIGQNGTETSHFGLIIACDGYRMKAGLGELWTMIVE